MVKHATEIPLDMQGSPRLWSRHDAISSRAVGEGKLPPDHGQLLSGYHELRNFRFLQASSDLTRIILILISVYQNILLHPWMTFHIFIVSLHNHAI